MSGLEAAFVTATATAVGAPLVNQGLQELRSRVEKQISLADLHKELNKALGWLLASQKDKDKKASSGKQKDTSHFYRHWTNRVSNVEKHVNFLNEKYEEGRKKMFLQPWIKPHLKKEMEEALKEAIELLDKCPENILANKLPVERVIKEIDVKVRVKLGRLSRTEALKMFRHTLGHNHLPPTAKPALPLEGESSSKSSTNAIGKQHLLQDVLWLMRMQDFLHLMLSYPMRIGYEAFLERWIHDVYRLLSFADDDVADTDSLRRRIEHLISESPLRYVQTLIPQDITKGIMNGDGVSTETTLKHVPQPVLVLANHLALHQLTLVLTSDDNIQNICFSTRTNADKQTVVENVQANSQIRAAFDDLQIIDLNQIDDETKRELVLLNLETWLEQTTNDRRSRHLVLVVDGDGDKKLNPTRVNLPINDSENMVVFITTLSSNYYLTSKVDLTIKTEDHLLPWELFCSNVGSGLVHSSIAIQEIAVRMVEKCGGHLLAVILMAKSLKYVTDVKIWETALEKLRYRDREAIVNAFFNIIWANVISESEKIRLIKCLMVFKFQDWKLSDDQLFACWFSEQLVDTERKAKSILRGFMECSILLLSEDTQGLHNIHLPEDIKIILHTLGEQVPENLSEGALALTISNLQVLNLTITHMHNLYDVNTQPHLKELNFDGCMLETLPEAIFKLQKLESLSLQHCSQLLELPPQITKLDNLKKLWLTRCKRLETLPQEIWELQKLETLSLAHCSQLQELPPLISKLENLETLILAGCELLGTLPQEIWELQNLEVCDVSGTQITYLPQFLNLPKLRKLLLGNNLNLMKIPSSFFDHVPLLNTLDLSHTSIHELSSSIFNLQELREIYLKDCELFVELPPEISRLKNLMTLDLDGTSITHLPKEIQELKKLESLSLSFYNDSNHDSRFDVIPYGVLTQFTFLKVLRVDVNSDNEWWLKNFESVLVEISAFKKLQVLDVYIPGVKFRAPIKKSLSNFRFIIGHHRPRMISYVPAAIEVKFRENGRSLKFVNGDDDFPDKVKTILSEAKAFFLDRHMTIKNLTHFGLENLKQLRFCILAECNEMQSIIEVDEKSFCMQFLTIFFMKNLRSIINRPILGHPVFSELKLLALHTCPELSAIFTMDFLHSLINLEELIVEDCPKVSSIISCPSSELTTNFFLPRLRKLSLLFVPELASISHGVRIARNLEQMGLYDCPKLQSLSTSELSSEKLKVIRAETEWWEKLQWSKADWGQEDPSHKFSEIFSPFDEDLDILTQLTPYELMTSFNTENDSAMNSLMIAARELQCFNSNSSNRSPFSPQGSLTQSSLSDQYQSLDNTYGSPISGYSSVDSGNEWKHCLMELEHELLGPEPDDSCGFWPVGCHQQASPVSGWNWDQTVEMIPKCDLKEVLITCAQAVSNGDFQTATGLMDKVLVKMVSISGDPLQRLGAYMLEGLRARVSSTGSILYKSLKCRQEQPSTNKEPMNMGILYRICPYWQFAYISANVVVIEAMQNESRVHIIDFQIAQGIQWKILIQALAQRPGGPPYIRVTGVDDSQSFHARGGGLHIVGQNLANHAKSLGVPFEFNSAAVSGCEVQLENLGVRPGEAVAVNFPYFLHNVPDESVSTENHRDRLLRLVKSLSPKVMTLVEQESNTNTSPFLQRFFETLSYYTAMFESIDAGCSNREDKERISAEQYCVARDIVNMIACEGRERVGRHELLGKWRSRLYMAGFKQCQLSAPTTAAVKNLLKGFEDKYRLEYRDGALYLFWVNRAMSTSSAWR